MDKGAWQATAHGGGKESDVTERLTHLGCFIAIPGEDSSSW